VFVGVRLKAAHHRLIPEIIQILLPLLGKMAASGKITRQRWCEDTRERRGGEEQDIPELGLKKTFAAQSQVGDHCQSLQK
jgi:hypothetical protein